MTPTPQPQPTPNNPGNTSEGVVAPAFTLTSLTGGDVSLSEFNNKVVVLFFFGNSCPTCKAVAPSVETELRLPFDGNDDYQLLGLDQWDGTAASVEGFKSSTKVTFPLLLKASAVAAEYKTTYDRLIVINKEGKIVFAGKQNGAADLKAARNKVNEVL